MGGSSSNTATQPQIQSNAPWSVAEPHLANVMTGASNLYHNNTGYQPYTGPVNVTPSLQTQGALAQTEALANAGDPLGSQAYTQALGLINQMPGLQENRNNVIGAMSGVSDALSGLAGRMQSNKLASENNLAGIAAGNDVQNPYLEKMISDANARNMSRISSSMSGMGRYGSGGHFDVAAKTMSETANSALGQAYENAKARQLQANQMIDSATMARAGMERGLLGDVGSIRAQQAGLYGGAIGQGLQGMQMAPSLNDNRYDAFQRVGAIGDYWDQRAMNDLSQQANIWNAEQAWPWEQLARYSAIANAAGQLGGTKVGIGGGQQGPSTMQQVLGGAMGVAGMGSMLFPGVGLGGLAGKALGGLGGLGPVM